MLGIVEIVDFVFSKLLKNSRISFLSNLEEKWRLPILMHLSRNMASAMFKSRNGRGLFVDCGSNTGQGFNYFRNHFKPEKFDYVLFEPNPNCVPYLDNIRLNLPDYNITIQNSAVSVETGEQKLYGLAPGEGSGGLLTQGGSILREHNSASYTPSESAAICIKTIDFPQFVRNAREKYSVIIVKIDIEGAEYDLLEAMIADKSIEMVDLIFLEFHSQYMDTKTAHLYRQRERKIVRSIRFSRPRLVLWI